VTDGPTDGQSDPYVSPFLRKGDTTRMCARTLMSPLLQQGNNSGKMVAGKVPFFTIIHTSCLIICASLKEIRQIVNEELMPQDLGDVHTDGQTEGWMCGRVRLYMLTTSLGRKYTETRTDNVAFITAFHLCCHQRE
jgi:hypothetical protein